MVSLPLSPLTFDFSRDLTKVTVSPSRPALISELVTESEKVIRSLPLRAATTILSASAVVGEKTSAPSVPVRVVRSVAVAPGRVVMAKVLEEINQT